MRSVLLVMLLVAAGCDRPSPPAPPTTVTNGDSPKPASDLAVLGEFQCNRCHVIQGVEPTTVNMDCRECHRQIITGTYPGEPVEYLRMWDKGLENMRDVPSLAGLEQRFQREWFIDFVQSPYDLRPRVGATMPRLAIDRAKAEALADALGLMPAVESTVTGDVAAGQAVLESKGCASCHTMSGLASPLKPSAIPVPMGPEQLSRATYLAPDLRHTRDRYRRERLVAWLLSPETLKSDALMPALGLTEQEAVNAAAFILYVPLAPEPRPAPPDRLPVLDRKVGWEEVQTKLFDEICLHCHSDPKYNDGDGGPGNTGGFGYAGKKLDVSSYDRAVRDRSVYARGPDGTPKMVAHLMARHAEHSGRTNATLGMPLGFPPIDLGRIQLLESWIAGGLSE